MRFATALTQFPLGLISAAIAAAILPALARQAAREEAYGEGSDPFCDTLARGLGLVLFLTIPATIGLLVLARPIVALLFQHGDFGAADTVQTARALRYYMIGLTFAAIDQPLIFGFYARKDTWRPALVGILGVGFYLAVALPTIRSLGMIGLILANGAQLAGHALVMIWLFQRRIGKLYRRGIEQTLFRSLLAVAAMGIAMWGIVRMAEAVVPLEGRALWATTVLASGATGFAIYMALAALFRVRELGMARALLRQAFSRAGWATRQLSP
jgi:putative peptidoglycan lipid II flippase